MGVLFVATMMVCGGMFAYKQLFTYPSMPEFNRIGKHIYFTYKGNSGHFTTESEYSEVDYDELAKFIIDFDKGKIKTKPLWEEDEKKD